MEIQTLPRRVAGLPVGLLALAFGVANAAPAAPHDSWRVFADCSAAYQVNAKVVDPSRAVEMTAQIADVVADYAATASRRLVAEGGGSMARARRAVAGRVAATSHLLSREPRESVERRIDACPQPD